jgi:hypothetical protein
MERQQDLEIIAKAIIDANQYLTLGTADKVGRTSRRLIHRVA